MNELDNLKKDYKDKKKEAKSFEEKMHVRHDYKEMKKMLKGANKLIKKNNLWESTGEFWSKFDFPSFEDYKKDNSSIKNNEILEEMNEKIEANKKQYEEQKKQSEEVMKKANETINQIDKKLAELDKENANEK